MLCETYREALIEAAASGLKPQGELRAHVEACGSCQTLLVEEQALFATIDVGVQTAADSEVPASLLPRVRAQLNKQTVPRRSWILAWAALAAAAALILTVASFRNRQGKAPEKSPENSAVAKGFPAAKTPLPSPPRPSHDTDRPSQSKGVERSSSDRRVSVLIPAGQKEVMDAFLAGLRRGVLKPEGLLAKKSEQPLQDLQVSPLDISPIEVKPLADVSGEATPESETARP